LASFSIAIAAAYRRTALVLAAVYRRAALMRATDCHQPVLERRRCSRVPTRWSN